jgi:hypothetical protein
MIFYMLWGGVYTLFFCCGPYEVQHKIQRDRHEGVIEISENLRKLEYISRVIR